MTTLNYIEISLDCESSENLEIIMAKLIELGYEGFTENDLRLLAYIPENGFNEEQLKLALGKWHNRFQIAVVVNRNWNEEWETSFEPVRLDDFCMVRAHFHKPDPNVKYDIVITPKMSFGTGHHATTYLMLEAMKAEDLQQKSVLDFGTGTGVLAILSEKMGAGFVSALDNDEWSINNGIENLERNQCSKIKLQLRDNLESRKKFDLVLANINRNVIIENIAPLADALTESGVLLLSGFLVADLPLIKDAMEGTCLKMTGYNERSGWLSVRGVLRTQ